MTKTDLAAVHPENLHSPGANVYKAGNQLLPGGPRGFRLIFYVGCAASVLLVILVGLTSYNALNRQQLLEKWVEHTYQVLGKTDSIASLFNQGLAGGQNMASGAEGNYALPDYMQCDMLATQLNSLRILTRDNQTQLARIDLLGRQMKVLWRTTGMMGLAAQRAPTRQEMRAAAVQISSTIASIRHAEELLLLKRKNAYKVSGRQARMVLAGGSALILVIVSFLIYMILTELNYRFRAYQMEHELNQLKNGFITLASHEFRTPLSSVLLSANLIARYMERGEYAPVARHAAKIKQVVHYLGDMLDDFLSLEKLDAGQVKAEFTSFDLGAACNEIIGMARVMAKPGQHLSFEPPGKPEMVCLDNALIEKAIASLLLNAIKYAGDNARILLVTSVTATRVVISVKDNGAGIAMDKQDKLSTTFFRVNTEGSIPGTGLGLNIVKRYVQLMKGTLHISSVPHQETCFEMTFPVARR